MQLVQDGNLLLPETRVLLIIDVITILLAVSLNGITEQLYMFGLVWTLLSSQTLLYI